jgi:hypothetical protein
MNGLLRFIRNYLKFYMSKANNFKRCVTVECGEENSARARIWPKSQTLRIRGELQHNGHYLPFHLMNKQWGWERACQEGGVSWRWRWQSLGSVSENQSAGGYFKTSNSKWFEERNVQLPSSVGITLVKCSDHSGEVFFLNGPLPNVLIAPWVHI